MPPKTTPKKPKTRSRIARGSPNVSPVFSVFPDRAARQRAIRGPAGHTRSRRGAAALTPGLSNTPTRTRTGRVNGARSAAPSTPAPTPSREQSSNSAIPSPEIEQPASDDPTQAVTSQPAVSQETAPPAVRETPATVAEVVNATGPATETTAAFSGAQSTSRGAPLQQEDANISSGGGKRSADGDGNSDPKRPRLDGTDKGDQDEGQQATQPAAPALNPCEAAAAALARIVEVARPERRIPLIENYVEAEHQMFNTTVFRAIASVAEAISQSGRGVQFSLLEDGAMTVAPSGVVEQPTTRPGHEVLIPWAPGDNHISLYIVRRHGTSNNFNIGHFDSSAGPFHRGFADRTYAEGLIRRVLNETGWNRSGNNTINPDLPVSANQTGQHSQWECGMHTILSAWAYTLGLELADRPQEAGVTYAEFLRQGRLFINLALCGYVDSDTIRAFLECFGFIQAGQTVPPERSFDNTIRLETEDDYLRHNARVRIETDLELRRANGENLQSLEALLAELADRGVHLNSLVGYNAQRLLDELNFLAGTEGFDTASSPRAAPLGEDADIPRVSPVDPDQLAITQALLDAAAVEQAARSAAAALAAHTTGASAAASNDQSGAAISAEADALQGLSSGGPPLIGETGGEDPTTSSADDSIHPPSRSDHSDSGNDNAPPGAGGVIGGPYQQSTDPLLTRPVNEASARGDQEDSRSSTPGSLSDAESDDGFFGAAHGPPLPDEVQPAGDITALAAFREEDTRRLARMRVAQERIQAARALEVEAIPDVLANQEGSEIHDEGDVNDDNGFEAAPHLPHADETTTQGQENQRGVQQGGDQQDDARQEESIGEDLQHEDTNDLFRDGDSLFGDDQPASLPTTRAPGLSLPPTPTGVAFSNATPVVEPQSSDLQSSSRQGRSPVEETVVDVTFADDDEDIFEQSIEVEEDEAVASETQPRGLGLSAEAAAVVSRWRHQDRIAGEDESPISDENNGAEDEHEIGDGYESP